MAIEGILATSAVLHTTDWTQKVSSEGKLVWNEEAKPLWIRRLDYSMIFIGIASICTSICGLIMGDSRVYRQLITPVVWLAAFFGIGSKIISVNTPRWAEGALFLAQGWACLLGYSDFVAGSLPGEWAWMLAGGLFMSVSVFAYILQWPKYEWHTEKFAAHEVFHLGTVGGFSCFYAVMLSLVPRVV
uniref:Hemolysin III n=1 Tax=Octactis speculum TaxID=3111310 RepID=A0A7S2HV82_9STRA